MFHKLQLVITSPEINKFCHPHISLRGTKRTRSKITWEIFDACLKAFLSDLLDLPLFSTFLKVSSSVAGLCPKDTHKTNEKIHYHQGELLFKSSDQQSSGTSRNVSYIFYIYIFSLISKVISKHFNQNITGFFLPMTSRLLDFIPFNYK